jgi:hypothetical protein
MTNRVVTLVAAALLGVGWPASAQTLSTTEVPAFELGVGYQVLTAGEVCDEGVVTQVCIPDRTYPLGLAVDLARNYGAFALVGELGWARDTEGLADFSVWDIAGGLRFTIRAHERIRPYGQILLGAVISRVNLDVPGFDSTSATDFMVQPGGGVNFVLGDRVSLFAQADYRRVFVGDVDFDDEIGVPIVVPDASRNDIRIVAGLRLAFY